MPWSVVWQTLFLAHILVATIWFCLMPGGFPLWHPQFWANRVMPIVIVAAMFIGLIGTWTKRHGWQRAIVDATAVGWTTALIVSVVVYPISARRFLLPALCGTFFMWVAWWIASRGSRSWNQRSIVAAILAVLVGGFVPWLQRGPRPATRPTDTVIPREFLHQQQESSEPVICLSETVTVRPSFGELCIRCQGLRLEVCPLLTFESRSPDRCWTILAPEHLRYEPRRCFLGLRRENEQLVMHYQDIASHQLRVLSGDDPICTLETITHLSTPVYSHLNTYCQATITGHRRLSLSFSPCPGTSVEVKPSDYPTGRPVRFAYVDTQGTFRVVEARSGEKGPFRTLAQGAVSGTDPLEIVVHDEGVPQFAIVLADWLKQADTTLSATAGWGVSCNSIEFSLVGDSPSDMTMLWISLSATSVGRGWNSVGHCAGTYRNRCLVKRLSDPTTDEARVPLIDHPGGSQ